MSDLRTKFEQLIEEQRELQKKFQEQGQALFKETFKEFFDKNEAVKAVVWTQYTPYFNDGDECTFSVNSPTFTNAEGDDLDDVTGYGEYDGDNEEVWAVENVEWVLGKGREYHTEAAAAIDKGGVDVKSLQLMEEVIQSGEMEDILRAMFDDHVKVIATRDGFDVQEYDHD